MKKKKIVVCYQTLAGDFCVHSQRRILQSLMPNKHPAFSLICLRQCYHMMDAKGVQKLMFTFADSPIAVATKRQAL